MLFSVICDQLPFHDISNEELVNIFGNVFIKKISYENLYFNPYNLFDKYNNKINPDYRIDDGILYSRLLCDYYYSADIGNRFTNSNSLCSFSAMVHNIRSTGKKFRGIFV